MARLLIFDWACLVSIRIYFNHCKFSCHAFLEKDIVLEKNLFFFWSAHDIFFVLGIMHASWERTRWEKYHSVDLNWFGRKVLQRGRSWRQSGTEKRVRSPPWGENSSVWPLRIDLWTEMARLLPALLSTRISFPFSRPTCTVAPGTWATVGHLLWALSRLTGWGHTREAVSARLAGDPRFPSRYEIK